MEKYAIYMVNPDSIDITDMGHDEVKEAGVDIKTSEDLGDLLRALVAELNNDTVSDQYFYIVTDEVNGIILYS